MKINVDRRTFSTAVKFANSAIPSRTDHTSQQCILLHADDASLTITGTSYDMTLQSRIPAEVGEPGDVLLNGAWAVKYSSKIRGNEVRLASGTSVELVCDRSSGSFPIIDPRAFPPFPEHGAGQSVGKIDAGELAALIGRIAPLSSREFLANIEWQSAILLTSTNGQLVAQGGTPYAIACTEPLRAELRDFRELVPTKQLTLALRGFDGEVEVIPHEGVLELSSESFSAFIRTFEASKAPLIQKMLDFVPPAQMTVSVEDLAEGASLALSTTDRVQLDIDTAFLVASTPAGEDSTVAQQIDCEATDATSILMAGKYLMPILEAATAEHITIGYVPTGVKPVKFLTPDATYIVMPVRPAGK